MASLADLVVSLQPRLALDVGCGCGDYSRSLAAQLERLVCVDVSGALSPKWHCPGSANDISFCRMDARRMGFPTSRFPVVFERASLHHVAEWETVLDEMFRVSSDYVVLEEPVDDPRSPEKRNTIKAQDLFLELQREVGFSHYRHLDPAVVLDAVARRGRIRRSEVLRTDDSVEVVEYFAAFSRFAAQSHRPQFWESRLQAFLEDPANAVLCQSDALVVLAEVRHP